MKKLDFFKILSYAEVLSFGKAQKNRKVRSNHVNDFLNVVKDGKSRIDLGDGTYLVFGLMPIVINPVTGHILDGQHKLEAFKRAVELGLIDENARILVAVWPIENEEAESALIINLNSNSKNWSLDDYMDCYAQYLDGYAKLKDFCKNHSLCSKLNRSGSVGKSNNYRYGAAIITGKGETSRLKASTFSFTDEQLAEADTIHKEMVEIRKKIGMPIYATGSEVEAMAIEWHTQRKFISVANIKALNYVPTSIKERQIKNKSDWNFVFCKLKDVIQTKGIA